MSRRSSCIFRVGSAHRIRPLWVSDRFQTVSHAKPEHVPNLCTLHGLEAQSKGGGKAMSAMGTVKSVSGIVPRRLGQGW